jgi:endonuclease G, mitochondrial
VEGYLNQMQINTQSKFNPFRSWLIYTLIIFSSLGWCGDQETRALTNIEREISINSFLQYESNPPINYLLYRGFAIKYLCDQHVPEYALHIISPGNISLPEGQSPAKRRSTFFVDDHQVRDCSAIPYDYKGSGYDRGHLVPAGDYVWNKFLKDETFVYSNIFPQSANLNRGIWRHLEDCVRRYSSENGVKLILITGGLYDNEDPHTIGKRGLEVPTHTYKIIFSPTESKMWCYLLPNSIDNYQEIADYQVTVDEIEAMAKEDFYDLLPDSLEGILESRLTTNLCK